VQSLESLNLFCIIHDKEIESNYKNQDIFPTISLIKSVFFFFTTVINRLSLNVTYYLAK
jgi:hypothetical protein